MAYFLRSILLKLQEKTVNAGIDEAVEAEPDEGKYLTKVTVNPVPTQTTTIDAPISENQLVTPDSGKLLRSVLVRKVNVDYNNNEITAGASDITVTPASGKFFNSVLIHPTPVDKNNSATPKSSRQTIWPESGKHFDGFVVEATPTQSKSAAPNVSTNRSVTPDSGKFLSSVTITPLIHTETISSSTTPRLDPNIVNDLGEKHNIRYVDTTGMKMPALYAESKRATADTEVYTPDTGYDGFSQFTVLPQRHTSDVGYVPTPDTVNNDLGLYHNIRYVDTTDMIIPSGNKPITSNGTNIDVTSYATVSVNVPSQPPNLYAETKRATATEQTYTPASGYDGFSQFTVQPQQHMQIYTPTEISELNFMGYQHNYAYVDTTRLINTEQLLWENSNPYVDFASNTIINLSDSLTNYDEIRILYYPDTSTETGTSGIMWSTDYSRRMFTESEGSGSYKLIGAIGGYVSSSSYPAFREVSYVSATQLKFGGAYLLKARTPLVNTSMIIPYRVYGIKFINKVPSQDYDPEVEIVPEDEIII